MLKPLIYWGVHLLSAPVSALGYLLFLPRLLKVTWQKRASLTAFGPLFGRWLQDELGQREDKIVGPVFKSLPGVSEQGLNFILKPVLWARSASGGYLPPGLRYPIQSRVRINSLISVRTAFFDRLLAGPPKFSQVVLLGAGYDTRAYQSVGTHFFEVDIASTQASKKEALSKAKISTDHVSFVRVDFEKDQWFEALLKAGFNPEEPSFFLWEGVTYYLSENTVIDTLKTIAQRSAPGSVVAFDYFSEDFVKGRGAFYGFLKWRFKQLGEPLIFGIQTHSPAQEHLRLFVERCGLTLMDYETYSPFSPQDKASFGGLAAARTRCF